MRRLLFLFFAFTATLLSWAQNREIIGQVVDRDTKDAIPQVTIQLLSAADSAFVAGALTDACLSRISGSRRS